ncbi:hypothetical protein D3C76_1556920 [compost metagenome]
MIAGHRQLPTEIEQAVLTRRQHLAQLIQPSLAQARQQQPQLTVEAIHLANRLDPWVVLGHPAAVAKPGLALVAGAGVDLRQAIAHVSCLRVARRRRRGLAKGQAQGKARSLAGGGVDLHLPLVVVGDDEIRDR